MRTLELTRGLSYFTPGMSCKAEKGKPFVVEEDKLAEALMATGKFREVDAADAIPGEPDPLDAGQNNTENGQGGIAPGNSENDSDAGNGEEEELTEKKVDAMKMPELIALAGEHDIDISECTNNEDRKALIKAVLFTEDPFKAEE
jgi:hypothetical protein